MRDAIFNGYPVHLVETVDEIHSLKEKFTAKVMCGVDTETKGLEFKPEQVVGVCLSGGSDYSVKGYAGYYLPIRHNGYTNLPIKDVMELTQWVIDNRQTVFHNRNFDASMIEYDGIKIPFVGGMHDSQIMCYLVFNEPYPALKDYCKRFLKWDMIEFSENKAEDHNFGCFSADTRFLTRRGFKTFDEIQDGEEIAQYNPKTKKLEFVVPTNKFDYFANKLYRIQSGRVDSVITDNHRVFSRDSDDYTVYPASYVYGKQRTLQLGTKGYDGEFEIQTVFEAPRVLITRDGKSWSRVYGQGISFEKSSLLKLLGFFLGDGSCSKYKSGYGSFEIFQSKCDAKKETVDWINSIQVGDFVHCSENDRMYFWKIHHRTFCDWVNSNFIVNGTKRIPRWVYSMPTEDRKILLDAFVRADGHYKKDRKSYFMDVLSSKELAEDILELCISVGLSAKMSVYEVDLSRVPTIRGRKVHLRKDKHFRIHVHPNKESKISADNWGLAKPQRVVCFSVPSSLLIVQRNYKTYISGNSTDPTVSFKYAAGDPVATVMLARKMWNDYPYIRKIYKIDNFTLEAVRLLSQNELTLDYEYLEALKEETERKLKEIQTRIYSLSGVYGFNIDSAKEKADVLSRFVTLTEKTKTGKFKTDEEALMKLNHPIARLMVEYSETRVFLKSFVAKMCSYKGRVVRANYNTVNVPSGRLSSGGSSGNPYFAPMNFQNCLVGTTRVYTPAGYRSLKDVKVGDSVWDGDFFREVLDFTSRGVQDVYRVELEDGKTIIGTKDHPILTEYGFKSLEDIVGVRVALNSKRVEFQDKERWISFRVGRGITNVNKVVKRLNYSDPRVWGLLGYYIGDGYTSRCKIHLVFDWKAEILADNVLSLCKELDIPVTKRVLKEKEGVTNLPMVTIYNADLWRALVRLGVAVGAHRKKVPDVLFKLPVSCRIAFLQGLYASDGLSEKVKTSPCVRTVSSRLALGVAKLCESVGINVNLKKYSNGKVGCGYCYNITFINRFNCFDVFTYLGQCKWSSIVHNKGLERYCLPKSMGGGKQRYLVRDAQTYERSKFWVKCKSVTFVGKREVFDIQVSESHRFCANSIIVHNCPKEEERLFLHHHPTIGYVLDREEEGCVRFKDGTPVKVKTKTGLHRAFIPHEKDWFIMTSDYSGQEMRLSANFSREPNLVEPLLAGKDIHNYVAKSMFGFEDPNHRTKVKVLNFACLYGAEGPTIANRLGVSVEEGKALFARYKSTMSKLYAWKAEVVKQAKRRGYSLTYFGRPIYLLKFLSSSERGKAAYAERLAVNSVVQGCLPSMTFVPSQDGKTLKTFHACIAERVLFSKDEKKLERRGVPTYRGKDLCYYVKFKSGDFVVCSQNHKFLRYKSERALLSIADTKSVPVQLVPPQKKVKFWSALFKVMTGQCSTTSLGNLFSQTMKASVPANDVKIASALLRAYLLKDELKTTNFFAAHTFRSLVDLYGYNLVQVAHGKYRLKWRRKRGAKAEYFFEAGYDNVVSPSMISGYQTYLSLDLFIRTPGADLMRLFLIKFTMLNKTNEEWRNNTRMILPVHDEQNLEVHKDYLYKAWKYMKKVMEFKPDNFVIPIVVDSGIGTSWGNCLDFDCISLKNRIVPKDLDPEALPDDERTYLLDIIKECDVRDLPVRLKKYKNE